LLWRRLLSGRPGNSKIQQRIALPGSSIVGQKGKPFVQQTMVIMSPKAADAAVPRTQTK
jgi:hypothetical protein